jgi:excisionase family DNA binding protein
MQMHDMPEGGGVSAYTVASLAAEWQCSEGVIRKAIANGELGCFRLGTLIRIPEEEVRRFECQTTLSSDSETVGLSSTRANAGSVSAAASMRPIGLGPRQRRDPVGARTAISRGRSG